MRQQFVNGCKLSRQEQINGFFSSSFPRSCGNEFDVNTRIVSFQDVFHSNTLRIDSCKPRPVLKFSGPVNFIEVYQIFVPTTSFR